MTFYFWFASIVIVGTLCGLRYLSFPKTERRGDSIAHLEDEVQARLTGWTDDHERRFVLLRWNGYETKGMGGCGSNMVDGSNPGGRGSNV